MPQCAAGVGSIRSRLWLVVSIFSPIFQVVLVSCIKYHRVGAAAAVEEAEAVETPAAPAEVDGPAVVVVAIVAVPEDRYLLSTFLPTLAWAKGQWRQAEPQHLLRRMWLKAVKT